MINVLKVPMEMIVVKMTKKAMRRCLTPEKSQTLVTTTKLIFWVNLSTKSKDGVNL